MPLPIITNTIDVPGSTVDDAQNLAPSFMYPCVGFDVDVRGPGFTTGNVTWTVYEGPDDTGSVVTGVVVSGQNTVQAHLFFDETVDTGLEYTIKACLTSAPTDCSLHTLTLLPLPAITLGTPNQPYVGGNTQFLTAFPFPVVWAPGEVDTDSGLATWATSGVKTVTYNPVDGDCQVTFEYLVYPAIVVDEFDEGNCVYVNSGQTLALTVSGGSGSYDFSITGQNTVSKTGIIQAGLYAGEYTLNIVDLVAGIIVSIPVCIGSQTQFCIAVDETVCEEDISDPCCEINVDCGETVALKIPTFHLRVNGVQKEIIYSSYSGGTVGEAGYLKSGSGLTDAVANTIECSDQESLFEITTSLDMADTTNAPFGIGFSENDTGNGVNSIDVAAAWFTSSGVRYVELREEGISVAASAFPILHGDVVSSGFKDGKYVLYINNLLKYETSEISCCGSQFLDISIEQPNKSIGGNLSGLTWTITTPGSPADVGSINENGVYGSPGTAVFGLVQAEASVGNATFRVNIRNTKPTARVTKPGAFLAGKAVEIWVGPYIPGFNETIRLAKDGSPDAIQNTHKGIQMINLGTLEGSANFQHQRDYQDFENDLGQIYHTSVIKETATVAASFLEVRDFDKMHVLLSDSKLHAKRNGVTELSVGGGNCDMKELRVILVVGQPECSDQFDVLYFPRVQNKGNLGLEIGRKSASKYEMTLTALPDFTRPSGKQLFSIYQIDSCSGSVCDN